MFYWSQSVCSGTCSSRGRVFWWCVRHMTKMASLIPRAKGTPACIFNTQSESNLALCYLILKMMLFFTHPLRPVNEHSKTDILTVPSFCHLTSAVNIYGVIERMFIANPCILYHIRFTWTCTWLDGSSFMDMIELLRNPRSNVAGETLSPSQP